VVNIVPWLLYPRERATGAHWIGSWVGPRASLDDLEKRTISCPCQDSNPGLLSPYPSYYTDYAVMAPWNGSGERLTLCPFFSLLTVSLWELSDKCTENIILQSLAALHCVASYPVRKVLWYFIQYRKWKTHIESIINNFIISFTWPSGLMLGTVKIMMNVCKSYPSFCFHVTWSVLVHI
jgi:hypothetical protein